MARYIIEDTTCSRYLRSFSENKPWGKWIEECHVAYENNGAELLTSVKKPMTFETIEQAKLIVDKMLNASFSLH